ncbi:hypothetical protein ANCCAN_25067 [Ancylostoma caninum]|uniref:Peptidase A1 domain-containing protein n=1 Tax=Ancylostoma caninum TaxID=29170 RepID=A0A368FG76_ANCCA|nr:hypothetical protein ANCCAN_25067 [Ancylostoma caninum]
MSSRRRCDGKGKFAPNKSSTFTPLNKNWRSIAYLGGAASGVLGSDRVNAIDRESLRQLFTLTTCKELVTLALRTQCPAAARD